MFLPRHLLLPLAVVTAAIALVGVINLALPHATQAAAFVVTKTADTNDGECSADDCSLREAVVAANAAAGPDTITVPPGTYTLTLAGAGEEAAATGDLDITDDVTIIGSTPVRRSSTGTPRTAPLSSTPGSPRRSNDFGFATAVRPTAAVSRTRAI